MKGHWVFLHRAVNEMILERVRLRLGKRGAWIRNIESSFSAAGLGDWQRRKS